MVTVYADYLHSPRTVTTHGFVAFQVCDILDTQKGYYILPYLYFRVNLSEKGGEEHCAYGLRETLQSQTLWRNTSDLLNFTRETTTKISISSHWYRSDTNTHLGIDTIDIWIDLPTLNQHQWQFDISIRSLHKENVDDFRFDSGRPLYFQQWNIGTVLHTVFIRSPNNHN